MRNHNQYHQCYVIKFRPCREEHEKEEAEKQYHFMNLARISINEEIANLKADEHHINMKIMEFSRLDDEIKQIMWHIKNMEIYSLGKVEPSLPVNFVPRTTGSFPLSQTMIRSDQKRCQKWMIKKGKMDMEYLAQVQEQLLCSKKCIGMTSCGTQELNDMIKMMVQRTQHGNKKRADEMKIYQEISNFKETKELYSTPETNPPYIDQWYTRERTSKRDIDFKRKTKHTINIQLENIERIKRKQIGRKARVMRLKSKLEPVRKKISFLEKELEHVNAKRLEAYKHVHDIEEQKKEPTTSYTEYQSLMRYAKELARKGEVVELKQACDAQVEEFMTKWNYSKGLREDYEKRKWYSRVDYLIQDL